MFSSTVQEAKTIVSVGCGPFPSSMLVFSSVTNAHLVGIDIDSKAVEQAETFMNHFQIENCSFAHVEGELYDYNTVDVIYIALMVPTKYEIIERAFATNKKKNFVVFVPDPIPIYTIFYDPLDKERLKKEGYQVDNLPQHHQSPLHLNLLRITKNVLINKLN